MTGEDTALDAVPEALREREQWVCWRERDRDGKTTKIPVNAETGLFASVTNADTWTSFDEAAAYAAAGSAAGVGFVFTDDDPFVGVDLDDCRDAETGATEAWATDVIETLDSYTERSPSGTGYHVLLRGELPGDRRRKEDLELYEDARFFTVTGEHVDGTPLELGSRDAELATVYERYVEGESDDVGDARERASTATASRASSSPEETAERDGAGGADGDTPDETGGGRSQSGPARPTGQSTLSSAGGHGSGLTDAALLEKARAAANGAKFDRLYRGQTGGYDSHSEADFALCALLAFWTGGDHDQVDRLFRDSGLYRAKWDERHYGDGATYGERTVERAIDGTSEFYEPPRTRSGRSRGADGSTDSACAATDDATAVADGTVSSPASTVQREDGTTGVDDDAILSASTSETSSDSEAARTNADTSTPDCPDSDRVEGSRDGAGGGQSDDSGSVDATGDTARGELASESVGADDAVVADARATIIELERENRALRERVRHLERAVDRGHSRRQRRDGESSRSVFQRLRRLVGR